MNTDNRTTDDAGVYNFEDWPIILTAGSTRWTNDQNDTSQMPYCNVGGWDNGKDADTQVAVNNNELYANNTFVYVSFLRGLNTICTCTYANFGR